jgi:oligoribonuclease NrnB/cAMP/cGMP phosphodiesterase (DHH superfamily)
MDVDLKTKFDIVVYHQGCPDGIGGAWVFWRSNRDAFFYPYAYGQRELSSEEVLQKRVVMVDCCFNYEGLQCLVTHARYVVVLDHHISTQRLLSEFGSVSNLETHIDIERSGAQLAWDYAYPDIQRPWFVNVIADRDLWKWSLPYSKEVSKALFVHGCYKFTELERLYAIPSNEVPNAIRYYSSRGLVSIKKEEKEIRSAVTKAVLCEMITPKGRAFHVYLATCVPYLKSDVGNKLATHKNCDFAAIWYYDFLLDEWWVSLRGGRDNDIDLSEICEEFYRGGGHFNAASFVLRGSKGQKLQDVFRILEVPPPRKFDAHLVNF